MTDPAFSPPPLATPSPDVPPALTEAVMKAMAKDPADRPTAHELEDLLAAAGGSPAEPRGDL